jgi:Topoisomerase DNA binding C4 zinc finger
MKFGIRTPSFKKRISARTSWKRVVRHNMGFKAPRGFGWFTNPKRALYNRVYNRTTVSADKAVSVGVMAIIGLAGALFTGLSHIFSKGNTVNKPMNTPGVIICPSCNSPMVQREGPRGKFYGCSRFPNCRGTRELTTATNQIHQ